MGDLRVVETSLDRVQRDAVEQLEKVLQRAREGEIAGFALAIVLRGGEHETSWTECYSAGALIGGVALLQAELGAVAIRNKTK
jgi:hypothetical protein